MNSDLEKDNVLWTGVIFDDGTITEQPLCYFKDVNQFSSSAQKIPHQCFYEQVFYPGINYSKNRKYIYFCSKNRNDVCFFIQGIKAAMVMTGKSVRDFLKWYVILHEVCNKDQ